MNPAHVIHDPRSTGFDSESSLDRISYLARLRKFAVRSAVTGEEDDEYFHIYICICMLVSGILWEV